MALAETTATAVPYDSFGVRIAIVRAVKGWNITQAGDACGIKPENWRLWEKTDRTPQRYEDVCRKIADASGYDRTWISAGGNLRSRCLSIVPAHRGQMELPLLPESVLVSV